MAHWTMAELPHYKSVARLMPVRLSHGRRFTGRWNQSFGGRRLATATSAIRATIDFDNYAMLDIPGAWQVLAKGQRFPVAHMETAELFRRLKRDPNGLDWQQLVSTPVAHRAADAAARGTVYADAAGNKGASLGEAIAEAKLRLAESLGIASEKIEITIRL